MTLKIVGDGTTAQSLRTLYLAITSILLLTSFLLVLVGAAQALGTARAAHAPPGIAVFGFPDGEVAIVGGLTLAMAWLLLKSAFFMAADRRTRAGAFALATLVAGMLCLALLGLEDQIGACGDSGFCGYDLQIADGAWRSAAYLAAILFLVCLLAFTSAFVGFVWQSPDPIQ